MGRQYNPEQAAGFPACLAELELGRFPCTQTSLLKTQQQNCK